MMLTIRCSARGSKLWHYDKIGPGKVLRCHKERIKKMFAAVVDDNGRIYCKCGKGLYL